MLLGNVVALPVTERIVGFAIAPFIAASVRDTMRQQRLITIVLAPLFAFVATTLAAVLFEQPIAGAALLPFIMFMVAYGAQCGPRKVRPNMVRLLLRIDSALAHMDCRTRNGDRFAPLLIWCVHRVTGLSSRDGLMKTQ